MTARGGWLVLVCWVAACSAAEQPVESGRQFRSVSYNDTTIESFDRTTRTVTGVIVQASDSIRFRIRMAGDDLVTGVDFTLHPATERGEKPTTRRIGMPKGTLPLMGTSIAFFEQLIRRARAVGGDSVSIPTMQIGAQASLQVLTMISNGPDSVVFVGPDGDWSNALHLAIDARGRVLGGGIPISGTKIEAIGGP